MAWWHKSSGTGLSGIGFFQTGKSGHGHAARSQHYKLLRGHGLIVIGSSLCQQPFDEAHNGLLRHFSIYLMNPDFDMLNVHFWHICFDIDYHLANP